MPDNPNLIPPTVFERLKRAAGEGGWTTDLAQLEPHLVDQRKRFRGASPLLLLPDSTARVAEIVRICAESRTPVVPQGGNTGLVGGATPSVLGNEVIINLARMSRVRSIDTAAATIAVEAGCVLASVQRAAEAAGYLFPLSLGAEGSCQIGGNLATNAGGLQVLRYGTARALTLGLEAVLPDGRIFSNMLGLVKDNTGYDLKQLFIGAEGTLGIITAAVLRLFPLPHRRVTALIALPAFDAALTTMARLRQASGDRMNACELMSAFALGLAVRHLPGAMTPFATPSPWTLLVEFEASEGMDLDLVVEDAIATLVGSGTVIDAILAGSAGQAQAMWRLREGIPDAQRREGGSIKHDISVPAARAGDFLQEAEAAIATAVPGARVCAFGHLGDGNLHYNISQPAGADEDGFLQKWSDVARLVHDLAVKHGGSISAEHGIGQLKREDLVRYKDPVVLDLMRTIKRTLDPHNIMNPGKVL